LGGGSKAAPAFGDQVEIEKGNGEGIQSGLLVDLGSAQAPWAPPQVRFCEVDVMLANKVHSDDGFLMHVVDDREVIGKGLVTNVLDQTTPVSCPPSLGWCLCTTWHNKEQKLVKGERTLLGMSCSAWVAFKGRRVGNQVLAGRAPSSIKVGSNNKVIHEQVKPSS
jgi:hypothetical protein